MLNVSNDFNEAFKSDLREVKMRIKIKDVTYTDEDIISFNLNTGSIVGETFAIGSTFANSVKLTLCKIVEGLKQLDEVKPEMGIVLPNGSIEFVKLGTFLISEEVNPDRNENRTSLECTDKMIMLDDTYESKLKYPAAIRDVAVEIANLSGVEVDHTSFARLSPMGITKPEGYTYRQAIGLVAQFEAGYATFNRDGLLAIKQLHDPEFKVTPDEYFLKGLTKNELIFRPSGIEVKINDSEDQTMSIGNKKGSVIKLENKVMTDLLLQSMYENIKNINYYPYTLKWRGNPAVEAGDWLRVTDTRGNEFKVPNLSYSLEYKGGLTATSTVETVASNEVKMGYKSILDQTVEYVNAVIKGVEGTSVYYGVEEPINPKEGDVWFKYNGPDTEIWVYERVGDTDEYKWVFKISSAKDDSIKEAIEELEKQADQAEKDIEESINKANQAIEQSTLSNQRADEAKRNADAAIDKANEAKQEAFNSDVIARDAKEQSIKAHQLGEGNRTEIIKTNEQVQLTSSKVENQQVELLNLKADSEGIKSSVSKTKSDLDNLPLIGRNYMLNTSDEWRIAEFGVWNFYASKERQLYFDEGTILTGTAHINNTTRPVAIKFICRDLEGKIFESQSSNFLTTEGTELKLILQYILPKNISYVALVLRNNKEDKNDINIVEYRKMSIHEDSKLRDWTPAPEDYATKSEFTSFEQNAKGFQATAQSDILGLKSEQTQMAGLVQSTVSKVDNIKTSNINLARNSKYNRTTKEGEAWLFSVVDSRTGKSNFDLISGKEYSITSKITVPDGGETTVFIQDVPNYTNNHTLVHKFDSAQVQTKTFIVPKNEKGFINYTINVNNTGRKAGSVVEWIVVQESTQGVTDWFPAIDELTTKKEFTEFSQTVEGFRQTAQNDINNLKSEQTQTAGLIKNTVEKVDSIRVGGVNQIRNSKGFGCIDSDTGKTTSRTRIDGVTRIVINEDNNKWNSYGWVDLFLKKPFYKEIGKTFTLSFEIDTSKMSQVTQVEWDIRAGNKILYAPIIVIQPNKGYERHSITWTIPENSSDRSLICFKRKDPNSPIYKKGEEVSIRNFKIEEGSLATDWQMDDEELTSKREFSDFVQTQEGFRQTVQSDMTGIKSEQVQMANQISSLVTDNSNMSAQITVQANQINQRVKKGDTISQINQEANRVLISVSTNRFMITPETTYIENATIKSAMIDTLNASKISAGTFNGANMNVININVDSLVGNKTSFFQSNWNGINNSVQITSSGLVTYSYGTNVNTRFDSNGVTFYRHGTRTGSMNEFGQNFYEGSSLIGRVGTADFAGKPGVKGIANQLDEGNFVSWSYKKSSSATTYTQMLALDPTGVVRGFRGIHADIPFFPHAGVSVNGIAGSPIMFTTVNYNGSPYPAIMSTSDKCGIMFGTSALYFVHNNNVYPFHQVLN